MEKNAESITFLIKLKYETKPGEEIYIYGDNNDFGNWSSPKFKLSWSKGHIWQAIYKLSKSVDYIKFKFVCHSKHYNIWEEGENRLLSPKNIEYLPKTEDGKYILNCVWEYFKINFNIHYILKNASSNMRIVGGIDALSNWNNPIKLEYDENKIIKAKDGNEIEGFWNITFLLNSKNKNNFDFQYRYSIFDENTKTALWEREPNRHIHILTEINNENFLNYQNNPDEYKLLTNSYLQILDVNFVADFIFNKMGDKNVFIGPYPQNKEDLISLSKNKINCILNVQSNEDLKYRQINLDLIKNLAKELNIELIHYPIKDFDSNDLLNKLKEGGDLLYDLLNKGKIVYVHCTAGMSRAAAIVIIYLVLYENFNVESAKKFCKKYRPVICPNYDVINKIAQKYRPGSEMLEKNNSNININDEWKKLRERHISPNKKTNKDEYNLLRANSENKSDIKFRKARSKKKQKKLKSILKQRSSSFRKDSCTELDAKSRLTRSVTFILDNGWEERIIKRKESETLLRRSKLSLDKKENEGIKKTLFFENAKDNKFMKNKIKKDDEDIKKKINKVEIKINKQANDKINQEGINNRNNSKNNLKTSKPKLIKKIMKRSVNSNNNNKIINNIKLQNFDKEEKINKSNNNIIFNKYNQSKKENENNDIDYNNIKLNSIKNNNDEISINTIKIENKKENKNKIIIEKEKYKLDENKNENIEKISDENKIEEKKLIEKINDNKNNKEIITNANKENNYDLNNISENESEVLSDNINKIEEEKKEKEELEKKENLGKKEKKEKIKIKKEENNQINNNYKKRDIKKYINKNNFGNIIKNIKDNKIDNNKRSNSITYNLKMDFKNKYLKDKDINKEKISNKIKDDNQPKKI